MDRPEMPEETEAYRIEHCDDPLCDLGRLNYQCPCCGKWGNDFEVWWKLDEVWNGTELSFECEHCRQVIIVRWDKDEWEYRVRARGATEEKQKAPVSEDRGENDLEVR